MIEIANAKDLQKALEPVLAVVGKGTAVNFIVKDNVIKASQTNEARTAMCIFDMDIKKATDDGTILGGTATDGEYNIQLDRLIMALKFFGDNPISIHADDECLVLDSNIARRTIHLSEDGACPKAPHLSRAEDRE